MGDTVDRELLRRAVRVLASASVLAEAAGRSVVQLTSGKTRGKSQGADPTGSGPATQDRIRRRLQNARTESQLRSAVGWAETELQNARRGPDRKAMTVEQYRYAVLTDHEGRHYEDAAARENMSDAWMRKVRQMDGRDPLRGRLIEGLPHPITGGKRPGGG